MDTIQTNKQLENLKHTLAHVAENSPFHKRLFDENGIDVKAFNGLEDLQKIPFVSKQDIQAHALDFWAARREDIVDFSNTSGTAGQPITVPLTENDLSRLGEVERQSFTRVGIGAADVILLTTTVNRRFMAGLAYVLGARAVGAGLIRTGPGLIENQWKTIAELKPTVIIAVPSFIVKMVDFAEANGIDFQSSSVKKVICIGESIRDEVGGNNALAKAICDKWDIELFSTYASSEMQTAFTECTEHNGAHVNDDFIVTEIVDEHGNPVKDGIPGELVVTTLGIEGFPLVRFRTGDVLKKLTGDCACGEIGTRLGPVIGRLNQMIKTKGTTCYPPAIASVLDAEPEVYDYQIQLDHDDLKNDRVTIFYHAPTGFDDTHLIKSFQAKIRFTPELKWVSEFEISQRVHPEERRKALRFLDLR